MSKHKLMRVVALAMCMGLMTGCQGIEEPKVVETVKPVPTKEVIKTYSGNIKEDINSCSLATGSSVYKGLKVTGKKLGDMDIYVDKSEDKYVIIAGEELIYLPIDKDGVVKLKDGVYNYWQELRYVPMTILVGKAAEKYQNTEQNFECGISYRGYVNPNIKCWLAEDGKTKMINLESLCESIGMKYEVTSSGAIVSACQDKFTVELHENAVLRLGQVIDCDDFEYTEHSGFIVGEKFLQDVLGMETTDNGNVLEIDGTLVPQLVLLDDYTATDAINKPYGKKKNKNENILTVKHMFGEYTQDSQINQGVMNQLFIR